MDPASARPSSPVRRVERLDSPDPALALGGPAGRGLGRRLPAPRQGDRRDGGVEGVLVRQRQVTRAGDPGRARPRAARPTTSGAERGPTGSAGREPARDHPREDLDGDRRTRRAGRRTATPRRPPAAGPPGRASRGSTGGPTVPLPPAWKVDRAPAAAGSGAVSVRRKRSRPSRPAVDERPDARSPERPRQVARAAGRPARWRAPRRPPRPASPSASRYQRGHEKAKSRPTIVDGSAATASSTASTASRRSRPVSSDGRRRRARSRSRSRAAARRGPPAPTSRPRSPGGTGAAGGYPIPTDWACCSFLPSVFRAGATITSHFWKLWIES